MNDEQMQPLLDTLYRDREIPRPKVQTGVAIVMTQVPRTRQQGRWSPFPLFRRKARTPTATDTTEHQSSPISATDGHALTVTGRTQTMFSPVKAITAGAIIFALGGVLLIAQPFGPQGDSAPGATTDEVIGPLGASYFTATDTLVSNVPPEFSPGPGFMEAVDVEAVADFEASDPRISGQATWTSNIRFYPYGEEGGIDPAVWTSSVRIENEDGAWVGTMTGFHDPEDVGREWNIVTGEGAYDGLTGVFRWVADSGYEGVIVPGDLPPLP